MLSSVITGISNIPAQPAISNPSHRVVQDSGLPHAADMAENTGRTDMATKQPPSEIIQSSPSAKTLVTLATQDTDTPPPPPSELSRMIQDLNRERLDSDPQTAQTTPDEPAQNLNMRL